MVFLLPVIPSRTWCMHLNTRGWVDWLLWREVQQWVVNNTTKRYICPKGVKNNIGQIVKKRYWVGSCLLAGIFPSSGDDGLVCVVLMVLISCYLVPSFFGTTPWISSHSRFSSGGFSLFHLCAEIGPLFQCTTDDQALDCQWSWAVLVA